MKSRKKIVMYVYNDITTDARVQRAANALADGFDLIVISTQKGKKVLDDGYKNLLVGGQSNGSMNIFKTIISAWRIIRKQRPDIVYCHDYYSAILAYLLLKTNYSGKVIYDAHELMIPEPGQNDKRLSFFYWFEKRIVKKVNLLICASEERGQIMKEHYGLKTIPYVVPNISQLQVNDNDPEVQTILKSLKDFFTDNKPTVVYAGAVTSSRRIGELVDVSISLNHQCKLLIVGNGPDLGALKAKVSEHQELKSAFTGAVPYKCLGSILSRCNIGFLYYPVNTLNNKYCASNKIYEYASVSLPVLANENPTVKMILESAKIGISTSNFENGLIQLINNGEQYKQNCSVFNKNNQWDKVADHLKKVVISL